MISAILLGAGNVGHHLYHAFKNCPQVQLKQWYNRSLEAIQHAKNDTSTTDNLHQLQKADIYIMALNDDVINEVSVQLPFSDRLIAHTSGMASIHELDKKNRRAVFYPLQTFSKEIPLPFNEVPLCIETLEKTDYNLLKILSDSLGCTSYKMNTEQRKYLHLSAVFVNNFVNQLYRMGHEIADAKSIDFDILRPLILETAKKVQKTTPYLAQTGPALRDDKKTIKKHLKLLDDEDFKNVYKKLTQMIYSTHGKKL